MNLRPLGYELTNYVYYVYYVYYGELAGRLRGCGQAMGIESTFASNMLKEVELAK